jgi:peptidyl-tRNA hydrolase, PTH1 family
VGADLVVVGLGNPGAEFERTRHNVGAEVVAVLAQRAGERLKMDKSSRALVARWRLGDKTIIGAVPQTYMNDSGLAVGALVRRNGIEDLERLVVVHDELDLPSGRVKVKVGGGSAGHNGIKSIHSHVHDPGYVRIRIGIGKPPGRQAGADYVLHRAGKEERERLDVAIEVAADAVESIASDGLEATMQRVNTGDGS